MDKKVEKFQKTVDLLHDTNLYIIENAENYTRFLKSAAWTYKYRFNDQVLIYAQKPEAKAVATLALWNKMGRYVNKGTKSISLLKDKEESGYIRLGHVFDISDTHGKGVYVWDYEKSMEDAVFQHLENEFDIEGNIKEPFTTLGSCMAILSDGILGGYEDQFEKRGITIDKQHFQRLVQNSALYICLERLHMEPEKYFNNTLDFEGLSEYNTSTKIRILGEAVNEMSGAVLGEIEATVKDLIRQRNMNMEVTRNEKDHIQERRGLPGSEPGIRGERRDGDPGTLREVRKTESKILEGTSTGTLQRSSGRDETVRTSGGDRQRSEREDRSPDEERTEGQEPSGPEQGSGRLGGSHEHEEADGRGDRPKRTNLRIENGEGTQISIFSSEEAESIKHSAFSFSRSDVERIFRSGSNTEDARMIIAFAYMQGKSEEEIVSLLKEVYHGGFGLQTADGNMSVWYDDDRIRIAGGNAARYIPYAQFISWETAAEYIGEMLDAGVFATQEELDHAAEYNREKVAERILYLYRDLSDTAHDLDYLSVIRDFYEGIFPEDTKRLSENLLNPAFRLKLSSELNAFVMAYRSKPDLLRYHFHDTEEAIQKRLDELELPLEPFASGIDEIPSVQSFITDDEIEEDLLKGGIVSGGNERIFHFFTGEEHSKREKAEFLKNEYGTGGHSHALSGARSFEMHNAKGIRYEKDSCKDVLLTWSNVADRIDELIREGRYVISQQEAQETELPEEMEIEESENGKSDDVTVSAADNNDPYDDAIFVDTENETVTWMYYNPDSHAGGQYVTNSLSFDQILEAAEKNNTADDFFVYLESIAYQTLADVDTEFFEEAEEEFMNNPDFTDCSTETMRALIGEAGSIRYRYRTGDIIHLEGTDYQITETGRTGVQMLPVDFQGFPVFRSESWESLERLLASEMQPEIDSPDETPVIVPHNFHITEDDIAYGSKKDKFRANMEAIRVLKECEFDNRFATPEEQEILSRYVGWGGLADAFDEKNNAWADEFVELYTALSPEEYTAARESTLTAFYTPPVVIRAIYDKLSEMGFENGNILEPSCGTGNFIGLLPEEMEKSKVYGIEPDPISGQIAKQLYQRSDIQIKGFEETAFPDNFFDIAIGNVPFGNFKIADKRYDKHNFLIHDYFFAKTIDKVRPGGVIAFITSSGTMDKQNEAVRKYIARSADLIGAVRLPNDTFYANAGTRTTTDILFLKKRESILDLEPEWVHLSNMKDAETGEVTSCKVNSYFVDTNYETVAGKMVMRTNQYGREIPVCIPDTDAEETFEEQLQRAMSHIEGTYDAAALNDMLDEETDEINAETIPADPDVRNFSYTLHDGNVYYRENTIMRPVSENRTRMDRIKGMIELRDCMRELMELEKDDYPDETISEKQAELNTLYDEFVEKYGRINTRGNKLAFEADSSYFLLCSLEEMDEEGNFKGKAAIFTKRTIGYRRVITSVDLPAEALAVSISEKAKVDLEYMQQLCGKTKEEIVSDLNGIIFLNPETGSYETADEYLSGNVRKKLEVAKSYETQDPNTYAGNVLALEKVLPTPLSASEISVRLGATWIDPEYVRQFIFELLEPTYYEQRYIEVEYSSVTGNWHVTKNRDGWNVNTYSIYGTDRANAYKIIEDTLNLKVEEIYDTYEDDEGNKIRVLNQKETLLAQEKQNTIKQRFQEWIWEDPNRREDLTEKYNRLFNSVRPREYDGSHIAFSGMTTDISLRKHQRDAVARILYGRNTLLGHVVGAGKTFTMVAAAMESKRLGLCEKSLFVVPKHLTMQWASDFLRLYPSANILVTTEKDFTAKNRKKFCARIATGDWDAVIMSFQQFEKIPMSVERQQAMLTEEIENIEKGIEELRWARGGRFTIKQMERTRKSLKLRLEKLMNTEKKDDVVTFEQLGVDRLFIDEAHNYKNLYLYTKMQNVGGIQQTDVQKSSDTYMKTRYISELTQYRGVIFATGTPISNSMTELYTMQRYLQYDKLEELNLIHFDAWASTFGETVTANELKPEGTGYRTKTRFAKFYNLPELMNIFKEVADIKVADVLALDVPKANYHTISVKPSEEQKEIVKMLSERADKVRNKQVDSSVDNMLTITNDGRKLALDQRIIDPALPDFEGSKVNICAENVYKIWKDGEAKRLTQLVFCDLSTPKKDNSFNVYDDLKGKLVTKGIPENEIAYIHDADDDAKKEALFKKVQNGTVRVLMGSTAKMGAGMNVQERLIAIHDLDCPWRPSDLEQRAGRIVRQGNTNEEVDIYRYVTEGTFDAYLYQTIENKQRFISQIMTSKSPVRSAEDIDEATLSYAEIKALAAGNPLIKEKMDLDIKLTRLKTLKSAFLKQKYALEDSLMKTYPVKIKLTREKIEQLVSDVDTVQKNMRSEEQGCEVMSPMTINGKVYTDRKEAGKALAEVFEPLRKDQTVDIGMYCGFDISANRTFVYNEDMRFEQVDSILLKGAGTYTVKFGKALTRNITRVDETLSGFSEKLEENRDKLEKLIRQQADAEKEVNKPFEHEEELAECTKRLTEVNFILEHDSPKTPEEDTEKSVSFTVDSSLYCESENVDGYATVSLPEGFVLDGENWSKAFFVINKDTDKVENVDGNTVKITMGNPEYPVRVMSSTNGSLCNIEPKQLAEAIKDHYSRNERESCIATSRENFDYEL